MDWKKIMHKENIQEQKEQKEQKVDQASATIAPFEDKNQNLKTDEDRAFDILDRLLGGGRISSMAEWRSRCRAVGVGELDMWRARLEIEQMELGLVEKDGAIKLKEEK